MIKVRYLKSNKVVLTGIIILVSTTAWFGVRLVLFMVDYKGEWISLINFKISITKFDAEENDTFLISVNLNNSHSKDVLIKLISFNVFENKTNDLLMTGLIDYNAHSDGLIVPGHS